jgi:hypothetical protein
MKNSKVIPVLLVVLLAVSPSCTFIKSKFSKSTHLSDKPAAIVMFDPKAPLVSPGAEAVRRLAELDPNVAVFASDVEAVERAAMKKVIYGEPDQNKKDTDKTAPPLPKGLKGLKELLTPARYEEPVRSSGPALLMFQGGMASAADRAHAAGLIGGLITGLKQIFSENHKSAASAGSVKDRKTETKDGTTSTMGVELSFNDDGSSTFGLELKTESEKPGNKFMGEMTGKVEGLDCPNAEGQVPLTVRLRLGGVAGGVGYTQELTAFIRATVDDNADIATTTIDLTQGTREVNKGREVYVETGMTVQYERNAENFRDSNWRLIRNSQNFLEVKEQAEAMARSGQDSALTMAMTVLKIAEHKWQNGGCVQIVANSPGNVAVSSTTQIPVKVTHKFGGADVPSKLEATLSGEASIDPNLIPRTAGTLTYVAPGETNKNATIKLKASSRRGRATLDLTASTGGQSYRVDGVSNGVSFKGEICSLNKPFAIDAQFPGGSAKTSFTPSNASSGSTTVSGGGGGCVHTGGGNYTVATNADGGGTITWTTSDKIACPGFNNSRTATFTLPLKPAPELTCR